MSGKRGEGISARSIGNPIGTVNRWDGEDSHFAACLESKKEDSKDPLRAGESVNSKRFPLKRREEARNSPSLADSS